MSRGGVQACGERTAWKEALNAVPAELRPAVYAKVGWSIASVALVRGGTLVGATLVVPWGPLRECPRGYSGRYASCWTLARLSRVLEARNRGAAHDWLGCRKVGKVGCRKAGG